MNVLVFTSLYPNNVWPQHGVFVKERMTTFAQIEGCSVKVVAPVPYFPPIKIGHRSRFSQIMRREVIEGLEVYHPRYFMAPKVSMALHGLLLFLSILPFIKKFQRDFSFDIIDAHYVYPDGFVAVLLGSFFRKPVVVSARGSDINLFSKFPLIRCFLQYTLNKADRVIAVSQALKDAMIALHIPEEQIIVISNGVDTEKFCPFSKGEARRKLRLPHHKRILLSVGRLVPLKGFDLLIKALKLLFEERHEQDLYLVIVGEGSCRKELEHLIDTLGLCEHVSLVGAIPHQELYFWYSAADLFCLASSKEGWPNVVLEALASGTPVVATDVGGIPEIIYSDRLGILTKRDERELAAGIAAALKKSWQSDALVQYARDQTWDSVASAVLHTFQTVLAAHGGPAYDNHSTNLYTNS